MSSSGKVLYIHSEITHNKRAATVIVPLLSEIKPAASILDVGCGTGTWLKVSEENGITDYIGLDGLYVDPDQLVIPKEKFLPKDLVQPFDLHRKFDWVICLEVAEHLPEAAANLLVDSLIRHGDFIIFSAAIPGQGGQNHINEQWPSYWRDKFYSRGYEFYDCIRPQVWNHPDVEIWYKQNIFIVTNDKTRIRHQSGLMDIVHPQMYAARIADYHHLLQGRAGVRLSFTILFRALKHFFKR